MVSIARLRAREKLDYGMFIHLGMITFDGQILPSAQLLIKQIYGGLSFLLSFNLQKTLSRVKLKDLAFKFKPHKV
jgi:hypothetical protein